MQAHENLIQEFVVEAKSHIDKIEEGLLQFEQGQADDQLIHAIFRSAHSIKGTAGFFGLNQIVALSHAMENLLGKIRSKELKLDGKRIENLLVANDYLKKLFDHVEESDTIDISYCLNQLQDKIPRREGKFEVKEQYRSLFQDLLKHGRTFYELTYSLDQVEAEREEFYQRITQQIESIGSLIQSYSRAAKDALSTEQQDAVFLFSTVLEKDLVAMAMGFDQNQLKQFDVRLQEQEICQLLTQAEQAKWSSQASSLLEHEEVPSNSKQSDGLGQEKEKIRVDVTLLNQLVNLAGEMVLTRNQLLRKITPEIQDQPGIRLILQRLDQTTTEMQEKIMRTRMQPLDLLFHSLPRLVRELGRQLDKQVNLVLEGKDVELDKSIIEGLVDPLAHLVRNALDHGIETPDIRKQLGKEPIAHLFIRAHHESGRVIITIEDDGAGIDLEKIRSKASQLGLIQPEATVSQDELLSFIFKPGLTTANQVNAVSGRGVGLDVVHTNIEKLGGTVEVNTTKNKGTTFRLILPLTLAIIPSFILETAPYQFALPQTHLQEIVRLVPGKNSAKIEKIQDHAVICLRGQIIPLIDLRELIGASNFEITSNKSRKVLILKSGNKKFGLIVDAIQDQEETLVKPLPKYLKERKIYSGVTILGNGKIVMVLDADGLCNAAKISFSGEDQAEPFHRARLVSEENGLTELLLFQCSGPEILAVPLSLIARVEEMEDQQMEQIGQASYYHSQGQIRRLIRPEEYLPITKNELPQNKKMIIIPKNNQSVAILAHRVQDTQFIETSATIQQNSEVMTKIVVNGKIIVYVHLAALFKVAALDSNGGQ